MSLRGSFQRMVLNIARLLRSGRKLREKLNDKIGPCWKHIAQVKGKDWRAELSKYLIAYKSTPEATTGTTPYFLVFGREMRSKRPELKRETNVTNEEVRDRDWSNKRGAATKSVEVGDKVLLKV